MEDKVDKQALENSKEQKEQIIKQDKIVLKDEAHNRPEPERKGATESDGSSES